MRERELDECSLLLCKLKRHADTCYPLVRTLILWWPGICCNKSNYIQQVLHQIDDSPILFSLSHPALSISLSLPPSLFPSLPLSLKINVSLHTTSCICHFERLILVYLFDAPITILLLSACMLSLIKKKKKKRKKKDIYTNSSVTTGFSSSTVIL